MTGRQGTIPARAGTTHQHPTTVSNTRDDPRAGGDDPGVHPHSGELAGRSPRGRGRRRKIRPRPDLRRTIPARAGTTRGVNNPGEPAEDDPRAGGDDGRPSGLLPAWAGRSPRGRGRQSLRAGSSSDVGTIPARAGTTGQNFRSHRLRRDDPRAGGDDYFGGPRRIEQHGRSPRGRGRQSLNILRYLSRRTIPARAGTTVLPRSPASGREDDPRAGGDDQRTPHRGLARSGRSPRGRGRRLRQLRLGVQNRTIPARAGTTGWAAPWACWSRDDPRAGGDDWPPPVPGEVTVGRSPRGRGRPPRRAWRRFGGRTIPARAGTTGRLTRRAWSAGDDPRAGGDDHNGDVKIAYETGRSPRGRGRPLPQLGQRRGQGTIPARAGTTTPTRKSSWRWADDPRAGGDDLTAAEIVHVVSGRSPRGRGRRAPGPRGRRPVGTIPARAGTTTWTGCAPPGCADDPRAGGDDATGWIKGAWDGGRSPRGRGRRSPSTSTSRRHGTIPARAGTTLADLGVYR